MSSLLHWQADSLPLCHLGSPSQLFIRDQYLLTEEGASHFGQRKNLSAMQIQKKPKPTQGKIWNKYIVPITIWVEQKWPGLCNPNLLHIRAAQGKAGPWAWELSTVKVDLEVSDNWGCLVISFSIAGKQVLPWREIWVEHLCVYHEYPRWLSLVTMIHMPRCIWLAQEGYMN